MTLLSTMNVQCCTWIRHVRSVDAEHKSVEENMVVCKVERMHSS